MGRGSGRGGSGLAGAAGAVLAAELVAPLLLLCGLCCWPDDSRSDTSSTGKPPQRPVVSHGASRRRRSSEVFSRQAGSSTASLHLPSTSGHRKQPLSAHRSHEEIPSRRRSHSHLSPGDEDAKYHSAPSVIDEVIHRRDWDRSTKELYIPLKPDVSGLFNCDDSDVSTPAAPTAESESSSVECLRNEESSVQCKKHYTNIKSSRNRTKKESIQDDVKDTDATENPSNSTSGFFIGDTINESSVYKESTPDHTDLEITEEKIKSVYKAKDAKQTFNESIKLKERPHIKCIDDDGTDSPVWEGYKVKTVDMNMDLCVDELDRSGAIHHDVARDSLVTCVSRVGPFPPPSVEVVGWEGGACYLAEAGSLRSRARLLAGGVGGAGGAGSWARHASDGDILAPTMRPESGAFSESDLELELEASEERPPSYAELNRTPRKETAI